MNKSEKILYHYTSLEGLLGIIKDKAIWATNILYLNDASELKYSIDLLKEELIQYGKLHLKNRIIDIDSKIEHIFYEIVMENIANLIPKTAPFSFFICSFSEEKDLLSQWRGYCPKGIGFSLGFKFSKLRESAKPFRFEPCIYEEEKQISEIRNIIKITSSQFATEIEPNWKEAWDLKGKQLAADLILKFMELAPTFKHPKFKEEKEWRIIASLQTKKSTELIKFRPGQSMIVPYIELPIPKEVENLVINHIVVGPSHEPILSKGSVEMLLKSKNVKFDEVQYSTIPYRNW